MNLAKLINEKLHKKEQYIFLETIRSAALRDIPESKKLREFLKKLDLFSEENEELKIPNLSISQPVSTSTDLKKSVCPFSEPDFGPGSS